MIHDAVMALVIQAKTQPAAVKIVRAIVGTASVIRIMKIQAGAATASNIG